MIKTFKDLTYDFLQSNAVDIGGTVNRHYFFYDNRCYRAQWDSSFQDRSNPEKGIRGWVIGLYDPFERTDNTGLVVFRKDWQTKGSYKPEYFTARQSGSSIIVDDKEMTVKDFWAEYYIKP